MTEAVRCINCHRRSRRAWLMRCECLDICYHSPYGQCECGGNYWNLEAIRQWRMYDDAVGKMEKENADAER